VLIAHTEFPAASNRPSFEASLRNTPFVVLGAVRIAASAGALHTAALAAIMGNSNQVA
jgi:hypothetical protein